MHANLYIIKYFTLIEIHNRCAEEMYNFCVQNDPQGSWVYPYQDDITTRGRIEEHVALEPLFPLAKQR